MFVNKILPRFESIGEADRFSNILLKILVGELFELIILLILIQLVLQIKLNLESCQGRMWQVLSQLVSHRCQDVLVVRVALIELLPSESDYYSSLQVSKGVLLDVGHWLAINEFGLRKLRLLVFKYNK